MSLSYFSLFNPSLGPDEDSLPKQLLFYTSAATSDLDSQLRNIGLVQGIVELGRSFSGPGTAPVNFIKSKDTRAYLLELEPGFWALLCLSVVAEDGTRDGTVPVTEQIEAQMRDAYGQFVLECDRLSVILDMGRDKAIKIIEAWWMRWCWSWTPGDVDAAYMFEGVLAARTGLTVAQRDGMTEWCESLSREIGDGRYAGIFVLGRNEVLWSDNPRAWTISTRCRLHRYVVEYLKSPTSNVSRAGHPEHADDASIAQSVTSQTEEDSWLSTRKWSTTTNRMLGSLSFRRTQMTPDGPTTEGSPPDPGSFQLPRPKRLHVGTDENEPLKAVFMNIFQLGNVSYILCLDSDESDVWTAAEQALQRSFCDANAPSFPSVDLPTSHSSPFFFSLVHDRESGNIYSAIPAISPALQPLDSETPQQIQSKSNTVHLHRQLYALSQHRESVIKTSRNIWIVVERNEEGTVMLCKSGKSGETMEEIHREGKRWITKLRRIYGTAQATKV